MGRHQDIEEGEQLVAASGVKTAPVEIEVVLDVSGAAVSKTIERIKIRKLSRRRRPANGSHGDMLHPNATYIIVATQRGDHLLNLLFLTANDINMDMGSYRSEALNHPVTAPAPIMYGINFPFMGLYTPIEARIEHGHGLVPL
ncbi:unnamed protein product [Prorocentrum cordatum]|uniref:Uncharacterized protein n=1 Tax=Prorocentrum cordatum TaxID=2364126 RepID=A0ABN9QT91_9DINO|nr:unnamed protein product [Polarella glacialis]